ncbi:MAG: hypothetical protein V4773_17255, partial [Verrucomicrobiota bacterium]
YDNALYTTEDGGATFTTRELSTEVGVRTIARIDDTVYAGGGGGTSLAARSNDGGATWVIDRAFNPDNGIPGAFINALVGFNGAIVAAGHDQLVDEHGRPWRTTSPITGILDLAASPECVVAVGANGIATAPLDPALFLEHDLDTTLVGGTVTLAAVQRHPRAAATRSNLQWSFNGQPIPNTTDVRTLRLAEPVGARAGTYTFTATAASGASHSTSITLDPQPVAAAPGLIDSSFRPTLSTAPTHVLPLPDGRVYVATGSSLLRLTADGSVDASFSVRGVTFTAPIRSLILDARQNLLVGERADAAPSGRTVRLLPDGALDATFAADFPAYAGSEAPILAANALLTLERRPIESPTSGNNFTAILRRYSSDGVLDSSFAPVELLSASTAQYIHLSDVPAFSGPRTLSTIDAQGRIYLAVQHSELDNTISRTSGTSRLFRLLPDGTRDASFTPRDVGPLHSLVATTDGLLIRILDERWGRPSGFVTIATLDRLRFDGTPDPAYQSRSRRYDLGPLPTAMLDHNYDVAAVSGGAFIARTLGQHGHFGFVRFDAEGKFDRDFSAELGSGTEGITQVHALADGRLLVAGTFRSLAGVAQPFLVRVTPSRQAATHYLANVSVRSRAAFGADTLIAGYTTSGGETSVLARAAGPALRQFGVANALSDPELALYAGTAPISGNDDWSRNNADYIAATAERVGAFPFAAGSTDSALYTTSASSPFTVQVSGKGLDGVALAELYHASAAPTDARSPRIGNLSVRSRVVTGSDPLIVGFTLKGTGTRNVLIRAVGPGLDRFGVERALPDTVLSVYQGDTVIARNDDWAPDNAVKAVLAEAFATVGAFPLDAPLNGVAVASSGDSALVLSLPPGSYTAHVTGKGTAFGVALVEVYEIP